jgi:hypothetical protein
VKSATLVLRCLKTSLKTQTYATRLVSARTSDTAHSRAGKVEPTPPRGACWGLCTVIYSLQIAKVYCKLSLHNSQSRNRRCGGIFRGLSETRSGRN